MRYYNADLLEVGPAMDKPSPKLDQGMPKRQDYQPPHLILYGTLEQLTHASASGSPDDGERFVPVVS